jgi:hypothetical protein
LLKLDCEITYHRKGFGDLTGRRWEMSQGRRQGAVGEERQANVEIEHCRL